MILTVEDFWTTYPHLFPFFLFFLEQDSDQVGLTSTSLPCLCSIFVCCIGALRTPRWYVSFNVNSHRFSLNLLVILTNLIRFTVEVRSCDNPVFQNLWVFKTISLNFSRADNIDSALWFHYVYWSKSSRQKWTMIKHASQALFRQVKSKLIIVMQTSEVDLLQFSISSHFWLHYSFFSLFFYFFLFLTIDWRWFLRELFWVDLSEDLRSRNSDEITTLNWARYRSIDILTHALSYLVCSPISLLLRTFEC